MIGINAKKHIQCQKCYCKFESVVGDKTVGKIIKSGQVYKIVSLKLRLNQKL